MRDLVFLWLQSVPGYHRPNIISVIIIALKPEMKRILPIRGDRWCCVRDALVHLDLRQIILTRQGMDPTLDLSVSRVDDRGPRQALVR